MWLLSFFNLLMVPMNFGKSTVSIFLFIVGILLCLFGDYSLAKRVVVLDTATTSQSRLQWNTRSSSDIPESGWTEETYTDVLEGSNARIYVVCDVDKEHVDNWLRTPFIKRGEANRLGVEIGFTIRDCKEYPKRALTCKETFSLYAFESEVDFASPEMPAWSAQTYSLVDRIAADKGRFSTKDNLTRNNETRYVAVTKSGVYFAFRDEGACTSLLSIQVYYDVCEETIANFAWFPETPTGAEMVSIQKVMGRCVEHAQVSGIAPVNYCRADGRWSLLDGACECEPGYQASGQQACIPCEAGSFKESPGFENCQPCPSHSTAPHVASSECICDDGYYRTTSDAKSTPCTRPPSKPRHAKVESKDSRQVVISWQPPNDSGGRSDVTYRIVCSNGDITHVIGDNPCPSQSLVYSPARSGFNSTKVTISNLMPATKYTFLIIAENGVTEQSQTNGFGHYVAVSVATDKLVSFQVEHFQVDAVTEDSATISWRPPDIPITSYEADDLFSKNRIPINAAAVETHVISSNLFNNPVELYEIIYFVRNQDKNYTQLFVRANMTSVTIPGLRTNIDYGFKIRARFRGAGTGSWSDTKWCKTSDTGAYGNATGGSASFVAGVIGSLIVIVLAICTCGIWYFFRGRHQRGCGGTNSDLDTLDYKTDQRLTPENLMASHPSKLASPLIPQLHSLYDGSGRRHYVDPLSYEDPNQAVREFANEINCNYITIEEIIGGGEFGDVCRGRLDIPGHPPEIVAIKTLKPGSSDKAKADFLMEASIMGQFKHPNVISLRGVITKTEPVMLITEYMANRSLDSFLKENDAKLGITQLLQMLKGIASGMKYLSECGYVHRDLAARNVLVDSQLTCKIADFGLSRVTEGSCEQVYTTKGGKIPVRWTSPEAIAYRKFTTASDVWSFGVVMWEVMSFGERPYWDWTNQKVIQEIDQNYRLPCPMGCPKPIHDLMLQCWQTERALRPSFGDILQVLERFLFNPEILFMPIQNLYPVHALSHTSLPSISRGCYASNTGLADYRLSTIASHYMPSSPYSMNITVTEWLRLLSLEQYAVEFHSHGFDGFPALMRMSVDDLARMGIAPHYQKRIFDSLSQFRQHLPATLTRKQYQQQLPSIVLCANNNNGSTLPRPIIYHSQNSGSCQTTTGNRNDGFFV